MNHPDLFQPLAAPAGSPSRRPVRLMDVFYVRHQGHTELVVVASRFGGGVLMLPASQLSGHPILLQELHALQASSAGKFMVVHAEAVHVCSATQVAQLGNFVGLNDPLQVSCTLETVWKGGTFHDLHQTGQLSVGRLDLLLAAQLQQQRPFTGLGQVEQQVHALTLPAQLQEGNGVLRLYLNHPDPLGEQTDNRDLLHLTLRTLIEGLQEDLKSVQPGHPLCKVQFVQSGGSGLLAQFRQWMELQVEDGLQGCFEVLDRHLPGLLGDHGVRVRQAFGQQKPHSGKTQVIPSVPLLSGTTKPAPAEQVHSQADAAHPPSPQTTGPQPSASRKVWDNDFGLQANQKPDQPSTQQPRKNNATAQPKDWDSDFD